MPELTLALFQSERVTLGQTAQWRGLPQLEFQRLAPGRSANSDPLRVGRDAAGSSPGRVAGLDIAGCLKYFPCRKSGRHRAIGVAAGFV